MSISGKMSTYFGQERRAGTFDKTREPNSAIPTPRSAENRPAAVEARRRPERRRIVIGLEGGRVLGQGDPGQLRARVDVDVGRQRRRAVERADADEAEHLAPAVIAPQRDAAGG